MSSPFESHSELDRIVHEPARLAILAVLSGCASADFLFLQGLTGLTKGNLSVHLAKLESAGLVEITKEFIDKKSRTAVSLTRPGRKAFDRHWKQLDELRRAAEAHRSPGKLSKRAMTIASA